MQCSKQKVKWFSMVVRIREKTHLRRREMTKKFRGRDGRLRRERMERF